MTTTQTELHQALLSELADIERQQQDLTLSPLDRQALDQAWEDTVRRLEDLETIADSVVEEDWRDARAVIDEWDFSAPETPPPPSPIHFAPSPPPILFGPGDHVPPPLSATRQEGYPPPAEPFEEPPPPPAPFYPDDEEIARWNSIEDDREGCLHCPGCHYCTGYGYDGNDEI